MSFIGADGKRLGALELNQIFTLRPLTAAVRQAINSPAYQR